MTQQMHDSKQVEAVFDALSETVRLLSETVGHLVENAVPIDNKEGIPESFTETEMPVAVMLSARAAEVANAAPMASLAAREFAQLVPQSTPT